MKDQHLILVILLLILNVDLSFDISNSFAIGFRLQILASIQ